MSAIRAAGPRDAEAIGTILRAAFPTDAEARLVERLADADAIRIALLAQADDQPVGYIALSEMDVESGGRKIAALGLAPVAVLPERQKQGIGSGLIEAALDRARAMGAELIVLLGDPAYYRRFGFRAETAAPFASPYAGPYLQGLRLQGEGPYEPGCAEYAPAFSAMEET